jgi:hypothetical protein
MRTKMKLIILGSSIVIISSIILTFTFSMTVIAKNASVDKVAILKKTRDDWEARASSVPIAKKSDPNAERPKEKPEPTPV